MDKMTNKKALEFVLENDFDFPDEVREKLEGMLNTLQNKTAKKSDKPTAKQIENNALREDILEFLRENPNRVVTCTEITKEVASLEGETNQRVAAILRPLVEAGTVKKWKDKNKTFIQIA